MIPLSKLSVLAAWRPGKKGSDDPFKTERHFWDFMVDGNSLKEHREDQEGTIADLIGVFGWGNAEFERAVLAKLLNEVEADYPPDRVALYVCPLCGDLGCGAVTVAVGREQGMVIWSDFRWEVNWYADHPDESTQYFEFGPFRFEFDSYVEVLNRAAQLRPKAG